MLPNFLKGPFLNTTINHNRSMKKFIFIINRNMHQACSDPKMTEGGNNDQKTTRFLHRNLRVR